MATGFNPPLFFQKATDAQGRPAPGAKLYHYVTQTSILKDIYADVELTIPLPQPLVANTDGSFQQYFMESGYYKFVLLDANNDQLLPPQDHVRGAGAEVDIPAPGNTGYLHYDISTNTYSWINGSADDHKVGASATDANPGYLNEKTQNTPTVVLEVVDQKLQARYVGDKKTQAAEGTDPAYLEDLLEDTDTITWERAGNKMRAAAAGLSIDSMKVKVDALDDIAGFLSTKLAAGTGVTFTITEDGVNGKVLHINAPAAGSGKTKVSADDATLKYLVDKILPGSNVTIVPETVDGGLALRISATGSGGSGAYYEQTKDFASALSFGSSTSIQNLCQLSLPAGTWDVEGSATSYVVKDPGATHVQMTANIVTASATLPNDGHECVMVPNPATGGSSTTAVVSRRRFVLASPTTVYLTFQVRSGTFAGGLAWGTLTAKQA